jgi:hypothetical protein
MRSIRAIACRAATMSPEIAQGRPGDTRSDVFSLGVVLREMLVGPRFATTLSDTEALAHARDGYVPSTFLELQLPKDVRNILRRALETDPALRYPHATAMAYELRRVALTMGVGDGRMFLRSALEKEHAATLSSPGDEDASQEGPETVRGSRHEGVALVALERRVGVHDDERLERVGLVAGLLAELAACGVPRVLACVDDAAGDLQRERVGAVTVLPDEDHLARVGHGDDGAPRAAAKREDVARGRLPVGIGHARALDVEDAVLADGGDLGSRPWANARRAAEEVRDGHRRVILEHRTVRRNEGSQTARRA